MSTDTAGQVTIDHADADNARGRNAPTPSAIPVGGWIDVLYRVWLQVSEDRAGLAAAGVAFYAILALFPTMAVFVSLYGLVTDLDDIHKHLDVLAGYLPGDALDLLRTELQRITSAHPDALSISVVLSTLFSLWSGNNGVRSMIRAMNIAYNEAEKRSFLTLLALSFTFTISGILLAILVINAVIVVPIIVSFLGLSVVASVAATILPPLLVFIVVNIAVGALYRWGPSRRSAKWRWITWGSATASVGWAAVSFGFAYYLSNWGNYGATYGSLGTVVGLMMWFYLSCYIVIVGAELNAELERQTRQDSTVGEDRPMGQRGAVVADTLGDSRAS